MFGEKQNQSVGAGAVALQSQGDINIAGASPEHVNQMVRLFLEYNFPRVREEARQAAEEHVNKLGETLKATLVASASKIEPSKLANPDVQATINAAVQASARRGDDAHPELLCSLIVERISSGDTEFKDIVISEAVSVVGRLTHAQIGYLSLAMFVTSMTLSGATSIADMEPYAQAAYMACGAGFALSQSQRMYLAYVGAGSHNAFSGGDIYEKVMTQKYPNLGYTDAAEFKKAVEAGAPTLGRLFDAFSAANGFSLTLTSVGHAIAIANLSRYLGPLDYSIWLN
ncbi:LPO_1073/Vpar_1526 family protein [Burkholderia pseudomultivorans]|uniref:LPO_1073/Vpar_1526 family protein n=1 Tax=Burkholderia pseudomultivorans TaxID=1207504 RepID=UPI000B125D60|nr:LPO_1073/Vpar_1526 family protein [Burkholderia pseudomultivorans]